jgi:hypothetical protein
MIDLLCPLEYPLIILAFLYPAAGELLATHTLPATPCLSLCACFVHLLNTLRDMMVQEIKRSLFVQHHFLCYLSTPT